MVEQVARIVSPLVRVREVNHTFSCECVFGEERSISLLKQLSVCVFGWYLRNPLTAAKVINL